MKIKTKVTVTEQREVEVDILFPAFFRYSEYSYFKIINQQTAVWVCNFHSLARIQISEPGGDIYTSSQCSEEEFESALSEALDYIKKALRTPLPTLQTATP